MKLSFVFIMVISLGACHLRSTDKTLSAVSKMPAFKILSIDSSTCIDTKVLNPDYPTIFMYFSPDCEHCQKETTEIIAHQDELRHTKIFLLSTDSLYIIKKFSQYYRLDTIKNIFVGQDFEYSFYKQYLPSETPYLAIYNKKQKLVKIYGGQTDISSIINSIRD